MWIEPVVFGLATVAVALTAWRGDTASRLSGLGLLLIWCVCTATKLTLGADVEAKVGAVLDGLAAWGCTLLWLTTGRCWPLTLMAWFMAQVTIHFGFEAKAVLLQGRAISPLAFWKLVTHPREVLIDALNVVQLLTVLSGPHIRDWARLLRNRLANGSGRDRLVSERRRP